MSATVAPRTCTLCGMPFEHPARRGRPRRYCSPACRAAARRTRRAAAGPVADETSFAGAVRLAIAREGSSLRELAARLERFGPLSTSVATLSQWQSGNSLPPSTTQGRGRVLALERCLGLPAGDLALLLPRSASRPDRSLPRTDVTHKADTVSVRYQELLGRIAMLSGSQDLIVLLTSKHLIVGSRGQLVTTRASMAVRAAHDDVDRYWFVHAYGSGDEMTVTPEAGCWVGRVLHDAQAAPAGSTRLAAVELLFDRVLRRGERHAFSFAVHLRDGSPPRYAAEFFRHVQTKPAERLELSVQFPSNAAALEIAECRWRERDLAEVWRRPVQPDNHFRLALTVADPAPGGYGWRWQFASAISRAGERSA